MKRKINCNDWRFSIALMLQRQPQAVSIINGSKEYPDIYGIVRFYQTNDGVAVYAEVIGLPKETDSCSYRVFGFHIHSGMSCTGNKDDPFSDAKAHYNPEKCEHPYHAGDLPPLFGNNGKALSLFLTSRISINEILGKTIIIHNGPDDFKTQPSGDSGNKIACGVIGTTAR